MVLRSCLLISGILLITLIKLFFFIYLFFGSIEINQIFASHLESFGQEISKVNADHIMNSFDILRGSGSWWDKHMWMGEPYNSISYLFSSKIIFLLIK